MADTNINIIFRNTDEPGTPSAPKDENKQDPNNPKQPKGDNSNKAVASVVGMQVLKTGFSYASGKVGEWYGSSQLQDQVNAVGQLVAYGAAIAINPVVGITALALNTTMNLIDYYVGKGNESRTLSVLKERAGNSLNRSR